MSSTWPCVSSPTHPSPSQIVRVDAEVVVEGALVVSRDHPRIARCTFESSHSSVTSSVPSPSASMPPPSSTRRAAAVGRCGFLAIDARELRHRNADLLVERVVVVLGPRVEAPAHPVHRAVALTAVGSGVAQPHAIGRHDVQPHRSSRTPCAPASSARAPPLPRLRRTEDLDALVRRASTRTISAYTHGIGAELARPVGLVVRPAQSTSPRAAPTPPACADRDSARRVAARVHRDAGSRHPR